MRGAFIILLLPFIAGAASARGRAYEEARLARVLRAEGLALEPRPEGKEVAWVRFVRHEVFVGDEVWPTVFNIFHTRTREAIVAREVLLHAGAPFTQALARETERNLRGMGIFALARVVAIATPEPGKVGVLVFTRDLWSLRLEQDIQVTGGTLDNLLLQVVERNLAGRNKQAALRFRLQPKSWTLGGFYADRRLGGGRAALGLSFDGIFNRTRGEPEGSTASLSIGMPLYSLDRRWGFSVRGGYDWRIVRQLSGGALLDYQPDPAGPVLGKRAWRQGSFSAQAVGLFQAGRQLKHILSAGLGFSELRAHPVAESALAAGAEPSFRAEIIPETRRSVFPLLRYSAFRPTWRTYTNLSSYGLGEDLNTGPWWSLSLSTPLETLGSTETSLVVSAAAGWLWALGDGLIEASVGAGGRVRGGALVDQSAQAILVAVTPRVAGGRLVGRASWEGRRRDTSNALVTLGGDNGLRGFGSQAFFARGGSRVRFNTELRTPPLVWQAVHLGAVAFFDAGSVYARSADFALHQSVGLGARLLFPHFNRSVYRFDLGVPLDGRGFSVLFSFGSGQAL